MSGYAEADFPVPVPRPVKQGAAGEAFAYLVLFAALGVAAYSMVELLFTIIDWHVFDAADPTRRSWVDHSIRWSIARIVIALPVFVIAAHGIGRGLIREPSQRQSPVRRWLTYIAMFLAVCVLVGDFVTLVAFVLNGETTMRFLLKVAAVAVVSVAILGYYLADLKREESSGADRVAGIILTAAFVVIAGLTVAGGLWMMRPPAQQSAERVDARRVDELRNLAEAVRLYARTNQHLPETLATLPSMPSLPLPKQDPATGTFYEYRVIAEDQFELCATFSYPSPPYEYDWSANSWRHEAGRHCFTRSVGAPD
jgi:hypothetical protein